MQAARNVPFNDDEFDDYAPSGGTHGVYDQPPLGAGGAYGYGDNDVYPLRDRRPSQGTTGTGGAGIAGLGAHHQIPGLQNPYADLGPGYPPQDTSQYYGSSQNHDPSYGPGAATHGFSSMDGPYPAAAIPHGSYRQDQYAGGYNNQYDQAPAAVSTGVRRQLSQTHSRHTSYNDDPYSGTTEEDLPPLPTPRHDEARGSSGTVDDDDEYGGGGGGSRVLKVCPT